MASATIPFSDIAKNITVSITVTGYRYGAFRLKCAMLLFRFAAYVGGISADFEVKTNDNTLEP